MNTVAGRYDDTVFSRAEDDVRPPSATLVSIVPFMIDEFKPGLIPGQFTLQPSVDNYPQVLVLSESIHWVYIDHDRGSLRVTTTAYRVARSVCEDYNTAQLAAEPDAHPGLFWLPGELTVAEVLREHAQKLAIIREIQINWFTRLLYIADDDWEKTRQHTAISDIQRYAARYLDPENKHERPWVMKSPDQIMREGMQTIDCPACFSPIRIGAAICAICGYIVDQQKHDAMSFVGRVMKRTINNQS